MIDTKKPIRDESEIAALAAEISASEMLTTEPDEVYYGVDSVDEVLNTFPRERAAVETAKKQYAR